MSSLFLYFLSVLLAGVLGAVLTYIYFAISNRWHLASAAQNAPLEEGAKKANIHWYGNQKLPVIKADKDLMLDPPTEPINEKEVEENERERNQRYIDYERLKTKLGHIANRTTAEGISPREKPISSPRRIELPTPQDKPRRKTVRDVELHRPTDLR